MEKKVDTHKDLILYKKSINFVLKLYKTTSDFPQEEKYGITSQIRRAGVSVPSNISEGAGRRSAKEFRQFLSVSVGSICELETLVKISCNLGYISSTTFDELSRDIIELRKMTTSLIKSLKTN